MSQTSFEIRPIFHPLHAVVRVPGSKSLTNRLLLITALADGSTTLRNALFSDDSRYFAESLKLLNFTVESHPAESTYRISGLGGDILARAASLFVGNAGTAARFLTAMLTLGHGEFVLNGDARMRQRPIGDLVSALAQLGAQVSSANGYPPVQITASGLTGGRASVSGDVSSQFLSGLLMVAPYARSSVELTVKGNLNSRPYVDMTLAVMAEFGVQVECSGYQQFIINRQHYHTPGEYIIESDATAASYFFAAPAICGGTVRVVNISRRSKQGDLAFLDILARMGCTVRQGEDWLEVSGTSELRGVEVDLRDIPDTAQTLAAIAPFATTPSLLRGIASARLKETDRVSAVCTELSRLGVKVEEYPDGLTINPCHSFRSAEICTYNDHRMAMAFSLIGLRVPGVTILDPDCVSKTFPNYYEVIEQLRS